MQMSQSEAVPHLTLGAAPSGAEPDCVHWIDPLAWADQEPPAEASDGEEAPSAE